MQVHIRLINSGVPKKNKNSEGSFNQVTGIPAIRTNVLRSISFQHAPKYVPADGTSHAVVAGNTH